MAKRTSSPNNLLTNVWDAAADTYTHVDIKGWLDTLDSLVGVLFGDREVLGSVKAWSSPSLTNTRTTGPDTNALSVPAGWAICDGRALTSGQHDFPAPYQGNTIYLPDYRGRTLVGADSALSVLVAGVAGVSVPGLKGRQGADTFDVPDHYHDHSHAHQLGGIAASESATAGPDDASDPYQVNLSPTGSGTNVTRSTHTHQLLALYTTNARDPANSNHRQKDAPNPDGTLLGRQMTTLQKKATQPRASGQTGSGNTGSVTITPAGGTAGDALTVNSYPLSEGVYWIMKVQWAASPKPWIVNHSQATVGS